MSKKITKTKTKGGKTLYKTITYEPTTEPTFVHQEVVMDAADSIKLRSKKGKEYWVLKSDRLVGKSAEAGDIAVLGIFSDDVFYVVDIIKKSVEPVLFPEDEKAELEKQMNKFTDLLGGY